MQKRWANISLIIAFIIFLAVLPFRHTGWAPYIEAMALAGLAGGIADWYAVTALFRHPLGLKWLPHTSIISQNRERIIEAIAQLVEEELLSAAFIESTIDKLPIMEWIDHLLSTGKDETWAEFLDALGRHAVELIPTTHIAEELRLFASQKASDTILSDYLANIIQWLVRSGNDRALFDFLSRHAVVAIHSVEFTSDMEQRLKTMLENYMKSGTQKFVLGLLESLGTLDYKTLSATVKQHLIDWLQSDKAFDQFELAMVRIMITVRDDVTVRSRIESVKNEAVAHVPWDRLIQSVQSYLGGQIKAGAFSAMTAKIRAEIRETLKADPQRQADVDALIKKMALMTVRRYHPLIGRLVRQNLSAMDERDWIDKLEWYVGRDLQWIRVNGAIVGAIAGLLLTVLLHVIAIL